MAARFGRSRNERYDGNTFDDFDSDNDSVYPMMRTESESEFDLESEADGETAPFHSNLDDPEIVRIYPETNRISGEKTTDRWKIRCLALVFCCIVPLVLLLAMILSASAHAFG